jgi:hypothetical protein
MQVWCFKIKIFILEKFREKVKIITDIAHTPFTSFPHNQHGNRTHQYWSANIDKLLFLFLTFSLIYDQYTGFIVTYPHIHILYPSLVHHPSIILPPTLFPLQK